MKYPLAGEITDIYMNYYEGDYYVERLETELRFKALMLLKLSQLEISFENFQENVQDYEDDSLFPFIVEFKNLNLLEYFVDKFEYKDREKDGGCIVKLYVPLRYEDTVSAELSGTSVTDNEIKKYEVI
jgi:hypothetical protein